MSIRDVTGSTVRLLLGAAALRAVLVLLGCGEALQWRVSVATPAGSLAAVREGVFLGLQGVSPWAGSQCRVTPLVLFLWMGTAQHATLYALMGTALDLLTAVMLRQVAARFSKGKGATAGVGPDGVMALYLFNPLTLAVCVGGSPASLHVFACVAALWAACGGRWMAASCALALGTYLDLHTALLLLPVAMLLVTGPEEPSIHLLATSDSQTTPAQPGPLSADKTDNTKTDKPANISTRSKDSKRAGAKALADTQQIVSSGKAPQQSSKISWTRIVSTTVTLTCLTSVGLLGLVLFSDHLVRRMTPPAACWPHAVRWLRIHSSQTSQTSHTSSAGEVSVDKCWAHSVYRLSILVEDQTPNIGQLWYLFTEMFALYVALFRFVAHSLSVILLVPMVARFPHRPLFIFTMQCVISCMFKAYPSAADHALYMALLPFLTDQLALLQQGLFLVGSVLLLAVLEASMWHQWIDVESANSNFYYSITLLIGAWQTLLVVLLIMLTVKVDRLMKLRARQTS